MKRITTLLLILATAPHVYQAAAESWPGFGGSNGDFAAINSLTIDSASGKSIQPRRLWQRTLGDGLSGLVVKDTMLFTTYLKPFTDEDAAKKASERTHTEVAIALDRATGKTIWKHEWDAGWLEDQEAFGGKSRAPQATPLIYDKFIATVGFTGEVRCLNRASGKLQWEFNAVDELAAPPVQFGFASSPIVHNGRLILMTGGKNGGLNCIEFESGNMVWNVPCNEASYATPVKFVADGTMQIAFVTRDDIIGVDAADGRELWRYRLATTGQTNVPTPLRLGDGRIAISGQGIGGTRELVIQKDGREWTATEGWNNRTQFFYCNWTIKAGAIVGCNDDLLVAIDAQTGKSLGRFRGYKNSNLVTTGDHILILDGEGLLTTALAKVAGLEIIAKHQVLEERCWTPPTLIDSHLFCRGGDQITCIDLQPQQSTTTLNEQGLLPSKKVHKQRLAFKGKSANPANQKSSPSEPVETVDPVEQIVAAFQSSGPDAAWKTYQKLRKDLGKKFSPDDRRELVELAIEQGLNEFGTQACEHIAEDFPDDADAKELHDKLLKKINRKPTSKKRTADNGLIYVEFSLKNNSLRFLQTEVKGPPKHPFGYGMPFTPGKVRIEKWPVGTKLYETKNGARKKVLVTIEEKHAGKTLKLFGK